MFVESHISKTTYSVPSFVPGAHEVLLFLLSCFAASMSFPDKDPRIALFYSRGSQSFFGYFACSFLKRGPCFFLVD